MKISLNVWYVSVPDQLNTSLAFICISIILTSAWLIISLVLLSKRYQFGTALFLGMYLSQKFIFVCLFVQILQMLSK